MLLAAWRQTLPLFWGKGSSIFSLKREKVLGWVIGMGADLFLLFVHWNSLSSFLLQISSVPDQSSWPFFNGSLNISLVFCIFVMYSLRVQTMLCVGLYSPLHIAKCSINSRYTKSLDSWTNWLFDRLMVGSPSGWQLSLPFTCEFRIIKELA